MKKLGNEKKQNVGANITRPNIEEYVKNTVGAGPVPARKEKGITLIALIITIIVMLILVMVTIQVLFNTGLFDAAGKATQEWKTEQDKEANMQLTIGDKTYGSIEEYLGTEEVDYEKLEEELKEKLSKESGNAAIDQEGNIVDLSLWNIQITGDGTCQIDALYDSYTGAIEEYGYNGGVYDSAIVGNIPAFVRQGDTIYKVTNLNNAFGLEGLTVFPEIPFTVTSIGNYAFSGCSGLTSIEIPASVTSIGEYAFNGCSGLININVDENNSVYESRGNAIIEIETNTLICGCKNTIISTSVTSIGECAFYDCSGLTSIEIPDSVTSIGNYAFYGCSSLTSIEIPDSVTSIGGCAFYDCSGLTSIIVEENNAVYTSMNNAIIEIETNTLICGCKNTIISTSVTSIGEDAFLGCSGLTSIEIPDSVTSIGYNAFNGCSDLTSIEISDSVTSIDSFAFSGCNSLTDVYYTGTEEQWKSISFGSWGNSYLTRATIHYNYTGE